ncbi:hypothetical protein [Mesorhizobium sp.]|uniref:hypothetical protein n=1 Tax=Mesorhizobium sp. TaxID=1871066 RepID=UPI000FE4C463|nr:hypothetical protein [Mesorhizobium sp.]RWD85083.1 MAG: hypothetical protein EOS48_02935 [Mesorhizobium sp.]TIS36410.1 MAG: hypothetical protein E5W95_23605 [Mesorhizobium sp.]TIX82870.1 MAG: hypothetical protein E5V21_07915 [Mesorhizobium sp.]
MTIGAAQPEIDGSSRPQKRMRGGEARSTSSLMRFSEPKNSPKRKPKEAAQPAKVRAPVVTFRCIT